MGKPEIKDEEDENKIQEKEYYPMFMLKRELMEKMGFTEDHPFKIFCNWRFKDSIRHEEIFKKNLVRM